MEKHKYHNNLCKLEMGDIIIINPKFRNEEWYHSYIMKIIKINTEEGILTVDYKWADGSDIIYYTFIWLYKKASEYRKDKIKNILN